MVAAAKRAPRGNGTIGRLDNVEITEFAILMPRYEVDWAGCRRVNMQNVAGWSNVPVRVLR